MNLLILKGNLTRDCEVSHLPSGMAICNFGIAVNKKRKDKEDEVLFIDCTAFGKTGETIAKYLSKGSPIIIQGELRLERWQDKDTNKPRSKHSVTVNRFEFVGGKNESQEHQPELSDDGSSVPF